MHYVKFHPEVACLLSRGKRKCTPGDEAIMKIHKKLFSGIPINFTFLSYLQNYKEFEAAILDLQTEKYGLSFDIKKMYYFQLSPRDENVIGIYSFKVPRDCICPSAIQRHKEQLYVLILTQKRIQTYL